MFPRIDCPAYIAGQSSFLSVEKDMGIIIGEMLKNERLKRLLFHTTKDALSLRNLTSEETIGLIGKNIKNIPTPFYCIIN